MFYVYLLQSDKDKGFYIGFTSNLELRKNEHLHGFVDSTKDRRPVRLIYFEAYEKEEQARKRESSLKKFGSAYVGLLKRLGCK